MPPNRRKQADTNILLVLRDWIRNLSSGIGRPERWTESFIARMLVLLALILWLLILILGFFPIYETQVPQLAYLPLYAFFPGEILSDQPNSNPVFLHAWGVGAGIVYFILAFIAVRYKKVPIAIAFMALFLMSTLIVYGRIISQLRYFYLHQ